MTGIRVTALDDAGRWLVGDWEVDEVGRTVFSREDNWTVTFSGTPAEPGVLRRVAPDLRDPRSVLLPATLVASNREITAMDETSAARALARLAQFQADIAMERRVIGTRSRA